MADFVAYFFGVKPGDRNGHFCHVPTVNPERPPRWADNYAPLTPWTPPGGWEQGQWIGPISETIALEAAWGDKRYWQGASFIAQPEGEARFDRRDGWTLVALWDRSADKRGGCCALFVMQKMIASDADALELARELFPMVFARIEKHLGRAVMRG